MKTRTLSLLAAAVAAISLNAAPIVVDAQARGEHLEHYWSFGVGAGRVNEGLRAAWHEHLVRAKAECGFRYVRMHDTFNDDMFVCFPQKNGSIVYNWQYIDEVYDRMLAEGVRPFVEFSFFPSCLAATNTIKQMWYRNCITVDPAKFGAWHDLCKAFVQHLVDRYGLEEIRKWYFEVWNEPNLYRGFLEGTKSDYFRLYKESALAVKEVHPSLKVGGPATSNFIADSRHDGEIQDNDKSVFYPQATINEQKWKGVWIEEFLAFCEKEKLPVDFISCHTYPTDYALDPVSGRGKNAIRYVHSVRDDFDYLWKTLAASAYPNAEIHITEWSTSPNSRDALHDTLPPAAYIAKDKALLAEAAARGSADYFFPSRLEDYLALRWADEASGFKDAKVAYALGNWLYDRKRHEEALACWERATRLAPAFPTAWRNLGVALWNVRRGGGRRFPVDGRDGVFRTFVLSRTRSRRTRPQGRCEGAVRRHGRI